MYAISLNVKHMRYIVWNNNLESIAATVRRPCTCYVGGLSAFVACHLISLDKWPGVRPIGISGWLRHAKICQLLFEARWSPRFK